MVDRIALPPGCYRNGTRYQSVGRYYSTNLCRWHYGAIRPIGGWYLRTDAAGDPIDNIFVDGTVELVRDMLSWSGNDKQTAVAFGTNLALKVMSSGGVVEDITPAGLPAGDLNPTLLTGYGAGAYGAGPYGVGQVDGELTTQPVARWKFDTWGENLLALPDWTGTIYEWTYNFAAPAAAVAVTNAPTDIVDFVVTDERIVFTIGSDTELRKVRWSDQENNTVWTPTELNQAGDRTLAGSGLMIGCYNVLKQVLILTETDAHVARYIGPPYVFSIDRIGEKCAPIHKSAVVATGDFAIWFGTQTVWIYDGTLRTIPCDIMTFVTEDVSTDMWSKVSGFVNSEYTEVWWLYASVGGTGEVDSYIMFDWTDNTWAHGRINRTAAVDRDPADTMLMVDYDGRLWRHEIDKHPFTDDGYGDPYLAFATTGPLEIADGSQNLAIRYIYPDSNTFGDVQYTFESRDQPTSAPIAFGPYAYNNPISTTGLMGRELMMTIEAVGVDWASGNLRIDAAPVTGRR